MNIHSVVTAARKIEDKGEAILAAALELFAERGFHGTAVPLIAERAGVGAGTVYRYFESKEAIVNALFRRTKGEVSEHVLRGFPFEASIREQLSHYWRRMSEYVRQKPQAYAFLELHHHQPYLDDESRAIEENLLNMSRQVFAEGQRQLLVKDDVPIDVLCTIVHGAFLGLVKGWRAGLYQLDEATSGAAERCVWEAIRR
jgi:AcrR family transcriptional regulator